MRNIFATLLLAVLFSPAAYSQSSTPRPPNTPLPPGESSSQQVQPPSVPLPPDSPMPDLGTLPQSQDKKQSAVKRKVQELVPHCLNIIWAFHTCWSQPPAPKPQPGVSPTDDPEFAKDMDVGDFYLTERRNYKGAELRFRDALEHKANDPTATFKLAQSLEGLGQADEARDDYAAYLKLDPSGHFVDQAKKALDRLQSKNADKVKESPTHKDPRRL
ncbi:MAG TPA: hypothetical protein VI685_17115 [Candidatus Angelobacter sp.]